MKALLLVAALFAVPPVAPRALAGTAVGARDGEVRGVSVLPATNRVEIVIDIQGAAQVQDFTLANPARLVIDLIGTRLTAPAALYDGQNRGGVRRSRPRTKSTTSSMRELTSVITSALLVESATTAPRFVRMDATDGTSDVALA